jgi:hypothetical protein
MAGLPKILENSQSQYYDGAKPFALHRYRASSVPFAAFLAALLCGCGKSEQHADRSRSDSEGAPRQRVPALVGQRMSKWLW